MAEHVARLDVSFLRVLYQLIRYSESWASDSTMLRTTIGLVRRSALTRIMALTPHSRAGAYWSILDPQPSSLANDFCRRGKAVVCRTLSCYVKVRASGWVLCLADDAFV